MLYHLHEMQRSVIKPVSEWAGAVAQLYASPYSPLSYTPLSRRISAALDLTHRLGKDYEKPEWRIPSVETAQGPVQVTPTVVAEHPFCKLIHFQRTPAPQSKAAGPLPRILVVAPLSGHHATLLRDTVRTLLVEHEVWITDWVDARMVPLELGAFSLDDYVAVVQHFTRTLAAEDGLHLISVCQPTVPVMAAVALMSSADEPNLPLTMTMMGGPIDARECPTEVNNLANNHTYSWFERNVIFNVPERYPGYLRRVYPGFLQHAGFVAMNPNRHMNSHYDYFQHLVVGDGDSAEAHREFYDEYNAVLDLAAEYYLQTIRVVFQEFLLPKGGWDIEGQRVRPQDIQQTALLTIEGELDDISGLGQTKAAHKLCTGLKAEQKDHYEVPGAGHYGIFSGRRWRTQVAPRIAQFVRAHDPQFSGKSKARPNGR